MEEAKQHFTKVASFPLRLSLRQLPNLDLNASSTLCIDKAGPHKSEIKLQNNSKIYIPVNEIYVRADPCSSFDINGNAHVSND